MPLGDMKNRNGGVGGKGDGQGAGGLVDARSPSRARDSAKWRGKREKKIKSEATPFLSSIPRHYKPPGVGAVGLQLPPGTAGELPCGALSVRPSIRPSALWRGASTCPSPRVRISPASTGRERQRCPWCITNSGRQQEKSSAAWEAPSRDGNNTGPCALGAPALFL